MQLRVSEKVKGELFVKELGKTFRKGSKIPMSQDQYSASATQAAIRAGFLEVIEGETKVKLKGKYYKNIHKNAISFRCIDMSVPSGSVFFVSDQVTDDQEIWLAEQKERIEEVNAKEMIAPKKKKSSKKTPAKKKKEAAVAEEDSLVEEETSVKADQGPETKLPEEEEVENPEGSYVHDPREDAEPMKIRRVRKPDTTWADDTKEEVIKETTDLFEEDGADLNFVDNPTAKDLNFVDNNGEVS